MNDENRTYLWGNVMDYDAPITYGVSPVQQHKKVALWRLQTTRKGIKKVPVALFRDKNEAAAFINWLTSLAEDANEERLRKKNGWRAEDEKPTISAPCLRTYLI